MGDIDSFAIPPSRVANNMEHHVATHLESPPRFHGDIFCKEYHIPLLEYLLLAPDKPLILLDVLHLTCQVLVAIPWRHTGLRCAVVIFLWFVYVCSFSVTKSVQWFPDYQQRVTARVFSSCNDSNDRLRFLVDHHTPHDAPHIAHEKRSENKLKNADHEHAIVARILLLFHARCAHRPQTYMAHSQLRVPGMMQFVIKSSRPLFSATTGMRRQLLDSCSVSPSIT